MQEKEEFLWTVYEETRSDAARNVLAEFYRPQIEKKVHRFLDRHDWPVTADDVLGDVWVRVLRFAIPSYDRHRGIKFSTFAKPHVRGAILDALRKEDWTPRSIRLQQKAVQEALDHWERQHGRPPTDTQLAEFMQIEPSTLQKIQPVSVSSLNAPCPPRSSGYDDDGQPAEKAVFFADTRELAPPQIQQRADLIEKLCRSCNAVERAIITEHFYGGQPLITIAERAGLSLSRGSQIKAKLLKRLREIMANRQDEFIL